MAHTVLCGSERVAPPGCIDAGKFPAERRLRVLLALRQPALDAAAAQLLRTPAPDAPAALSRAEFAGRFAASAQDLQRIQAFADDYGLRVEQTHAHGGTAILEGSVQQFDAAFRVDLRQFQQGERRFRGRTGAVSIPKALEGIVTAVLGLDDRPQARPPTRALERPPEVAAAIAQQYTPAQLAELYGFPEHDGAGQCIGIIALDGGYETAKLAAYFAELRQPAPQVVEVLLAGAQNRPTGNTRRADVEVQMDVQIAGAIAPAAKIVVYFAPNTDNGFLEAIVAAIHDREHAPDVLAISWGFTESLWTPQSREAYNRAFQAAALMGITVCVASGDDGASDGQPGLNVCFPASSPFVLACGGTRLRVDAQGAHEQAWAHGGGGQSAVFAQPAWQQGLALTGAGAQRQPLTMRGVPDVAANADAQTGYYVHIDGLPAVMGGTSAAAPLWAALLARCYGVNGGGRAFLPPRLYARTDACRDVVEGGNGGFHAAPGWDACTGLGVPYGTRVAAALAGGPPAPAPG